MARARNIKPGFFLNDDLAENNCALGRLLFIGLWTIADYKGDLEWRAGRIKTQILPYDECDIKKLAINLDKSGFVRFYSDGEKIYLNITNFIRHQNPHKNERASGSDIPAYSDEHRQAIDFNTLAINRDKSGAEQNGNGTNPADSLIPLTDSLLLIPSSVDSGESPVVVEKEKPPKFADEIKQIFEYWAKVMGKNGRAKLTKDRQSCIVARLKESYTVAHIMQAIDGCKRSEFHMGKNDKATVYDDLTLICRSGSHIEKFAMNIGAGEKTYAGPQSATAAAFQFEQQRQAMSNRIAQELAELGPDGY